MSEKAKVLQILRQVIERDYNAKNRLSDKNASRTVTSQRELTPRFYKSPLDLENFIKTYPTLLDHIILLSGDFQIV